LFRWLWKKIKALWQLAKSERASPTEIGWAIGLGVFVGCSPALGFHGAVALAAATIFRKNRLFTWIGSRMSNILILPFIAIAEVQISHRLRTGTWLAIDPKTILDQRSALLLDWILGMFPVGGVLGALFGVLAWRLALRRDRKREAAALPATEGPGSI
jgi:uncharacterized protein (DUF2062 family)